jgi:hypothetical protein
MNVGVSRLPESVQLHFDCAEGCSLARFDPSKSISISFGRL